MTISEFLPLLHGVSGSGRQYSAKCPAHNDQHASLSISEAPDGKILLQCHAGCTITDICSSLGLKVADLFQTRSAAQNGTSNSKSVIVAEYVYKALDGSTVCKKVRLSNKQFYWLHPNGNGWAKGRGGKTAPLYNQCETNNSKFVYVVEGEKDVETLRFYKIPAVSLPDGAKSKWQDEYTDFFKKRSVAIIQDNDIPGKDFAQMAASKISGIAEIVKVIDLSKIWQEIPEHGDVTDYFLTDPKNGYKKLEELAKQTEEWKLTAEEPSTGVIQLSDVQSTKTQWLWKPYIPLGKITLMTADPGTGKTFFCLYLAAQVSTGRPFYGTESGYTEPRTVVYQTAEDGIADTIKPRLEPMQPNFKNIYVINEETEALSLSDERIENVMKTYHPSLMIFDPLQAYLGADVDMHRANEVRPVLAQIGRLAEKYNCAVVFIMHNSKMGQNQALYRALGSIDIPAIARSMLILGKNPDNPQQKVLCHEKSSLAMHGKSILFNICPDFGGIVFDGFTDLKADDILNPRKVGRDKPSVTKDQATEELLQLLGEDGYVELADVKQLREEIGCSERTIYNAKKDLQLDTVSIGYSINKRTYWLSPDVDKEKFREEHNHPKNNILFCKDA